MRSGRKCEAALKKEANMQKLVEGIHNFQKNHFSHDRKLFETLVEGQSPLALFITCSDSRIDPNRLTQTNPGELFIQRTAGNIIPPYGAVFGGEAATIEYAVSALKVRDIIVCGHSHCGAMAGLLDRPSIEKMPAVRAFSNMPKQRGELLTRITTTSRIQVNGSRSRSRRTCLCS